MEVVKRENREQEDPPKFNCDEITSLLTQNCAGVTDCSPLYDLDLGYILVNEWIVIQRRRFDLILMEEPYHAIQLLFNYSTGTFIHRLWSRTVTKGYLNTLKDLASLCRTTFYKTVPCLGLFESFESSDHPSSMSPFENLNFPIKRKVSTNCLQYYKLDENEESAAVTELLGIGMCSECLNQGPKQEFDSDLEYGSLKSENDDLDTPCDIEGEFDEEDHDDVPKKKKKKKKRKRMKEDLDEEEKQGRSKRQHFACFLSTLEDGSKSYVCEKCGKSFKTARSMNYHRSRQHQWGPFTCPCCDHQSEYSGDLCSHFLSSHPGQALICPSCQEASFNVGEDSNFLRHYRLCFKKKCREERSVAYKKCKPKKVFKCELCGKGFVSRSTLKGHMDWHKGLKPIKCTECDFATSFATSMYTHNKIHLREKGFDKTENDIPIIFKCEHCGKSFNTTNYMREHIKNVHENKPDQRVCEMCGYVCTNRTNLRRHKAKFHPTDNSKQCKTCGYLAADNTGLQIHLRVHGEPSFICRFCAKALKSKQSLQAHERSHTGENPFRCNYCSYACKSSSVLRKHIVLQHEKYDERNKNLLPINSNDDVSEEKFSELKF